MGGACPASGGASTGAAGQPAAEPGSSPVLPYHSWPVRVTHSPGPPGSRQTSRRWSPCRPERRAAEAAARQVDAQGRSGRNGRPSARAWSAVRAIEGQRQLILLRRQRDLLSQRAGGVPSGGRGRECDDHRAGAGCRRTAVCAGADRRRGAHTTVHRGPAQGAAWPVARRHSAAGQPCRTPRSRSAAALTSLPTLPDRRPDLIALQFGYASQNAKTRAADPGAVPAPDLRHHRRQRQLQHPEHWGRRSP